MPVTHFASNVYLSSFEDLKNKYTADPTSLEAWQKDKKEYDDINVMLRELCEFHEVINKRFKVENSRPSLRKYICARRDCSFFVSLAHTPQGTWRVKKCSSHSCEGPAPTQPRVEGGRGRPSKGDVFTAYTREFLGGALKTAALHAREAVSTRVAKELLTKICRASPSNEYLRCLVHEVRADMEGNLDALKSEIWLMSLQREWGEENVRLHHEGKEAVEAVMSGHVAREEEASKKGTESSVAESVIQGELPEEVPEKVADVMKPSIEPTKLDVLYPEHYEKVGETRGNEESVVMPSSAGMPGSVGLPSVAIPILAPTMSHPMEVPTPAAMNTPSMLHPGAPSILLAGAPAAAPVSAMSQSDVESSTIITTTAAVSSAVSSEQGEGMVSAPSGAGGEEGSENTSVQVEGASGEGPTAMTLADGEVEGNGEMKRDDQYMSSQLPLVPSSDVEEKPEEKPEQSMLAPPKSDQEESASQRPEHEVSVPPKPDQEESGQQRTEHVVSVPPQPEQQQLHVQDGQGGGESHSALPAQPAPAEIPEAPKLSSKLDVMKSNLERLRYNTYYTGVSVILPPVRKLLDLDLLGTCFCVESQDSHYKENGCFYSFAGYDASGKVMPIAFAWYWKKDDDYNWSLFFSHIRDYLGRKLDMPPHIVVGTSECRAAFFNHFKSLRFFHSIPERQEEVRKAVGSRDASTFMEMATTMNEALYHEKKTELSKAGRNFIFGESAEFAKERNLPRDREQFAVFALSLSGLTTTKAASVFGNVVNSDKHGNAAEALYRICMHIQKEYNDTKDHIDEKMRESVSPQELTPMWKKLFNYDNWKQMVASKPIISLPIFDKSNPTQKQMRLLCEMRDMFLSKSIAAGQLRRTLLSEKASELIWCAHDVEVDSGVPSCRVHLFDFSCTCGEWGPRLPPCRHAMALHIQSKEHFDLLRFSLPRIFTVGGWKDQYAQVFLIPGLPAGRGLDSDRLEVGTVPFVTSPPLEEDAEKKRKAAAPLSSKQTKRKTYTCSECGGRHSARHCKVNLDKV